MPLQTLTQCPVLQLLVKLLHGKREWNSEMKMQLFRHILKLIIIYLKMMSVSPIHRLVVLWTIQQVPTSENLNDIRWILLTYQNGNIEKPVSNVLLNHLKKAILQCSLWTCRLQQNITCKDPCEWGWRKADDNYESRWSTNPTITMEKL